MAGQVRYADRKDAIREALVARARSEGTVTYAELGGAVGMPAQGPWRGVLDEISREETATGRPDITHLVVNKATGVSSRIEFSDARRPSQEQRDRSRTLQEAIWAHYRGPAA